MPHVQIKTSVGPVHLHYTISTPTDTYSKSIDKSLPTVVFLHPVFIAQEVFHSQFGDPQLRRFNLVALDSRCHGETRGRVRKDYGCVEAAQDVARFMDALRLPPCHIVGLSQGSCTALQLAISHPDKVLSVFMISPHPEVEPADVTEGLQEIYDCWTEGFKGPGKINEEALQDALHGALQFGFNCIKSKLTASLMSRCYAQAMINWCPTRFEEFHTVSVKFVSGRQSYSQSALASIVCPVRLVHCSADIAYQRQGIENLRTRLHDAGVNVQLIIVKDACHFGNVTHAEPINALLHDFLLAESSRNIPPAPDKVISPWEAALFKDDCEDDSDGESEWTVLGNISPSESAVIL